MIESKVPTPADNDPTGVSIALETAATLWDNGGLEQALEWVRRASTSAEEAGDDMRSLTLARAAAEIADSLNEAPASPPAEPEAEAEPEPVQARPVSQAPPPPSKRAVSAPVAPSSRSTSDLPPPAAARSLSAPPPPSKRGKSLPKAPSPPMVAKSAKAPTASAPAPAARTKSRPVSAPAPAKVVPNEKSAAVTRSATPTTNVNSGMSERLHVSVKASVRDPNLLLVRVLGKTEKAPAGTNEAWLTSAISGVDLLDSDN